jgi:type IX secretion system substrate protein
MKKQLLIILLYCLASPLSQAQSWQWGKRGGSTDILSTLGDERWEEVIAIVTDSHKNIYTLSPVGQMNLTIDGNPKTNYGDSSSITDFALSSFACDGTYRWSKIIGGGGVEYLDGIQVDNQDNVYISGRFTSCSGPYYPRIDSDVILNTVTSSSCKSLFITKFDTNGNMLWFRQPQQNVSSTVALGQTSSLDLSIDTFGNSYWLVYIPAGTYAGGAFTNSLSDSNLFLFKYDTDGNFMNAMPIDIQIQGISEAYIHFYRNPNNGNLYFTGEIEDGDNITIGGQSITHSGYIACFNNLGVFQWKKENTSTQWGRLKFYNLVFDTANNIYISGKISGQNLDSIFGFSVPEPIGTSFVLKTDSTADTLLWSTYYNHNGAYSYGAIALNGNEVGYAGYCFSNNFTWGTQSIFASNINEGTEVLLARFNKETGVCLSLNKIPGNVNYNDYGTALAVDISGDYIIGGGFGSQITTSNSLINSGSQTDFFIAKFATTPCSQLSSEEFEQDTANLYPNPVKENVYWQGETSWSNYEVYSVFGQKVAQGNIEAGLKQINLSNLNFGVYLLKCSDVLGKSKVFKIIKE